MKKTSNYYASVGRKFVERILSDYVTPTKGGYRINSNTSPQAPFQLGRLRRELDFAPSRKYRKLNNVKLVKTPGGKNTMYMKQIGAVSSKSSGFFSKGSRKYKRKRMIKIQKKSGINHTAETNGTVTGVDTAWIGHITAPKNMLYNQAIKAIFVKFMNNSGIDVVSADSEFNNIVLGTSTIGVDYRLNSTSNWATNNFVFTGTPVQKTMNDFVIWFTDPSRSWSGFPEVEFQKMYWIPGSNRTGELQINAFLVNFEIKSTLKIQNRSVNQLDGRDVTDESDVVPVYGKSYFGKGTHFKMRKANIASSNTSNNIAGDVWSGVVSPVETDVHMKEPPQGYVEFTNCKAVGKAHLDPGHIKTSVLTDRFSMYFSTLHFLLATEGGDGAVGFRGQRNIGKIRVFCLEKMINTSITYGITIAYEHNYEVSCNGYSKRKFAVVKSFEKI